MNRIAMRFHWQRCLVLNGLLVITESWIGVGLCLLASVILILVYVLSKKFYLEIHSQGGPSIGLLFKPNVIEGVQIDVERHRDPLC